MTVRKCKGCGLVHDTLMACGNARRLLASGKLPQPSEGVIEPVTRDAKTVTRDAKAKVPVTRDANVRTPGATAKERMAALRRRKLQNGMVELRLWYHPDDVESVKAHHASSLDKLRT